MWSEYGLTCANCYTELCNGLRVASLDENGRFDLRFGSAGPPERRIRYKRSITGFSDLAMMLVKLPQMLRSQKTQPTEPAKEVSRMLGMYLRLKNLLEVPEEGQGLVEYALIIVLVSIVAIVALGLLGTAVSAIFTQITATL
jgi:pilus assembly protein Flp/PilA